jgi:hypothetical protein
MAGSNPMAKKAAGSAQRKKAKGSRRRQKAKGPARRKRAIVLTQRRLEKLGGTAPDAFTGMLKPVDGDNKAIMFARAGDSSNWVEIPNSHIDDIQPLDTVHSDGHTRPLVHLFMKEPESIEGKTFAALAYLHKVPPRATATTERTSRMLGTRAGSRRQAGSTPCYWDWGLNRWVCP